jgi:hypothetical protein
MVNKFETEARMRKGEIDVRWNRGLFLPMCQSYWVGIGLDFLEWIIANCCEI